MQCPVETFPVHRGKSGVQKPAGLGTLSKPTKTVFCSWLDLPRGSAATSLLWQIKVLLAYTLLREGFCFALVLGACRWLLMQSLAKCKARTSAFCR